MGWISRRVTTRVEDTAYCLLCVHHLYTGMSHGDLADFALGARGIFDVNMPLLYGEEEKAFRRLQEEIIKTTSDLSIFAWECPKDEEICRRDNELYCGILAESPMYFRTSLRARVVPDDRRLDFSISNNGVKMHSILHIR
jgi:hypothetical protein